MASLLARPVLLPSGREGEMNIVVFGASGRTGRKFVDQALWEGHTVKAFVRDPGRLRRADPRLTVIRGDVLDAVAVDRAIEGVDAVVSMLGPRPESPRNLISQGTRNIVQAMERQRVMRLVCVSVFGVGSSRLQLGYSFSRFVRPLFVKNFMIDLERMEKTVRRSGLDWVIVRPAELVDEEPRGRYRASDRAWVGRHIARADLASFVMEAIEEDEWLLKAPTVGY